MFSGIGISPLLKEVFFFAVHTFGLRAHAYLACQCVCECAWYFEAIENSKDMMFRHYLFRASLFPGAYVWLQSLHILLLAGAYPV